MRLVRAFVRISSLAEHMRWIVFVMYADEITHLNEQFASRCISRARVFFLHSFFHKIVAIRKSCFLSKAPLFQRFRKHFFEMFFFLFTNKMMIMQFKCMRKRYRLQIGVSTAYAHNLCKKCDKLKYICCRKQKLLVEKEQFRALEVFRAHCMPAA